MAEDRKQRRRGATERDPSPAPDEGFLSRWSRRKRAVGTPESLADVDARVDENEIPKAPSEDIVETVNEKTDADMPPVESLDENSDYSQFLSPKVSQTLRSVALRKLFRTAGFNIRDGLDDYDEDFTSFEPLGNTITADMRYHMEREKEKERQRLAKLAEDKSSQEQGVTEQPDDERQTAKLASTDDDIREDKPTLDSQEDDADDDDDSPHGSRNKS